MILKNDNDTVPRGEKSVILLGIKERDRFAIEKISVSFFGEDYSLDTIQEILFRKTPDEEFIKE